ncbi:hypothetical protein QF041_005440 [Paenibacillus sp. W2I17]|nr:hypothetical protein [Paenibacillus sp. W2I17]
MQKPAILKGITGRNEGFNYGLRDVQYLTFFHNLLR